MTNAIRSIVVAVVATGGLLLTGCSPFTDEPETVTVTVTVPDDAAEQYEAWRQADLQRQAEERRQAEAQEQADRRQAEAEAVRFGAAALASCSAVGGTVVGDELSSQLFCQSSRFTPSGKCGMWAGFNTDGTVSERDMSYSPGCWSA